MAVISKSRNHPKTVSHYTTLQGLQGIIQSGCLWASNATFLNDKAELEHALAASRQAMGRLEVEFGIESHHELLNTIFREFEESGIPDTYVTCFCANDDNLSQWRGYGGSDQGVCLTFDRDILDRRLKNDGAVFMQVKYSRYTTARKLSEELKGEISQIVGFRKIIGEAFDEVFWNNLMKKNVSLLLPKFKHIGFKDEKEVRFVVGGMPEKEIFFRVSRNKMVPYIEIGKGESALPLISVRIGPGSDQGLTVKSVKTFLNMKGYDVPVEASEVPFRA